MGQSNVVLVIFSYGMSATRWKQMGILSKEKVIFEAYLNSGLAERVVWFTYHPDDPALVAEEQKAGRLHPGITVLPAPAWAGRGLGKLFYSVAGPWFQRDAFTQATAMINHQTSGCWTGLTARLLLGGRFVYRYGHSLWRRHLDRKQYARLAFSWPLDRLALACSDHALVCTESDYRATSGGPNVSHCPNFIELESTATAHDAPSQRPNRGVYVGRLMSFKNLFNLIEACAKRQLPLDLYGDGPLRGELEAHAAKVGAECRFLGVRPNHEVRDALTQYRWFFLVSNYEAMPKALLEGMAAGCVCVAAPNYGCAEVIEDGVDGVLSADWEADSIADAMARADGPHMDGMASRAMTKVRDQYSLERVLSLHRKALLGGDQ